MVLNFSINKYCEKVGDSMKIINNIVDIELNFETLLPIEDICFFDIETTGLSREFHNIYLIGILYYDLSNKNWILTQFFADSRNEEKDLLIKFKESIKQFKIIVSYNGDNFDIPFVKYKMDKYNIEMKEINSFDLYKFIRENKFLINLPNLKLKTIETFLGIDRIDTLSGKECIAVYKSFLKTSRKDLLNQLLQHNYDDLQHMPSLLKIINLIYEEKTLNIKINESNIFFYMETIDLIKDSLIVTGSYSPSFKIPWKYYHSNYSISLDNKDSFLLDFEIKKAKISDDILAEIADMRIFNSNIPLDHSPYNTPDGILILRADKTIYTKNIKTIIETIFRIYYNKQ